MSLESKVSIVSFYTRNTPYEQEIENLQASCENLSLPLEVFALPCQGSWEKNVALKPQFLLEKIQEAKGPLLWVDADAIFLQKPDFSLFKDCDVSVRFMEIFAKDPRYALNAATLYLAPTDAGKAFIAKWAKRAEELAKEEIPFVDQIALYDVLQENKEARVLPMPAAYCKIYDLDQFFVDDEDVVIEQRQASRRKKWKHPEMLR